MTTIRPAAIQPQPAQTPAADAARAADMRAFFDMAMGRAPAAAAVSAAPAAPAQAAAQIRPTAAQTAEPAPPRILRPGSLLDIRV